MFVVRQGGNGFTWELRRFGGVVLQRGTEALPDVASAREAGDRALTALCQMPDLPKFKREAQPKLSIAS